MQFSNSKPSRPYKYLIASVIEIQSNNVDLKCVLSSLVLKKTVPTLRNVISFFSNANADSQVK
jgi:hypothetical protein